MIQRLRLTGQTGQASKQRQALYLITFTNYIFILAIVLTC